MEERPTEDPQSDDPTAAQDADPAAGASDDPRVDPTPDRRQTDDVAANGAS